MQRSGVDSSGTIAMTRRRPVVVWLLALLGVLCLSLARGVHAQEGVFLSEEDAPHAVFPEATFIRSVVQASAELRQSIRERLQPEEPSVWEESYVVFAASHDGQPIGSAVVVEEIGKHRPITFIVGVRNDGSISDVAVMAYREAYGGEIRAPRFLKQYRDKDKTNSLKAPGDIQNIAGATLSVDAASRAVKKALAVATATTAAPSAPAAGDK